MPRSEVRSDAPRSEVRSDAPRSEVRSDAPFRGQVYWLDIPGVGRKPWLVVSNEPINRTGALDRIVAVRISTVPRTRHLPTVVPLGADEPLPGCVLAGTVMQLRRRWFAVPAGVLSARAMRAVDHALKEVLSLP